jgi:hypothetical protein
MSAYSPNSLSQRKRSYNSTHVPITHDELSNSTRGPNSKRSCLLGSDSLVRSNTDEIQI